VETADIENRLDKIRKDIYLREMYEDALRLYHFERILMHPDQSTESVGEVFSRHLLSHNESAIASLARASGLSFRVVYVRCTELVFLRDDLDGSLDCCIHAVRSKMHFFNARDSENQDPTDLEQPLTASTKLQEDLLDAAYPLYRYLDVTLFSRSGQLDVCIMMVKDMVPRFSGDQCSNAYFRIFSFFMETNQLFDLDFSNMETNSLSIFAKEADAFGILSFCRFYQDLSDRIKELTQQCDLQQLQYVASACDEAICYLLGSRFPEGKAKEEYARITGKTPERYDQVTKHYEGSMKKPGPAVARPPSFALVPHCREQNRKVVDFGTFFVHVGYLAEGGVTNSAPVPDVLLPAKLEFSSVLPQLPAEPVTIDKGAEMRLEGEQNEMGDHDNNGGEPEYFDAEESDEQDDDEDVQIVDKSGAVESQAQDGAQGIEQANESTEEFVAADGDEMIDDSDDPVESGGFSEEDAAEDEYEEEGDDRTPAVDDDRPDEEDEHGTQQFDDAQEEEEDGGGDDEGQEEETAEAAVLDGEEIEAGDAVIVDEKEDEDGEAPSVDGEEEEDEEAVCVDEEEDELDEQENAGDVMDIEEEEEEDEESPQPSALEGGGHDVQEEAVAQNIVDQDQSAEGVENEDRVDEKGAEDSDEEMVESDAKEDFDQEDEDPAEQLVSQDGINERREEVDDVGEHDEDVLESVRIAAPDESAGGQGKEVLLEGKEESNTDKEAEVPTEHSEKALFNQDHSQSIGVHDAGANDDGREAMDISPGDASASGGDGAKQRDTVDGKILKPIQEGSAVRRDLFPSDVVKSEVKDTETCTGDVPSVENLVAADPMKEAYATPIGKGDDLHADQQTDERVDVGCAESLDPGYEAAEEDAHNYVSKRASGDLPLYDSPGRAALPRTGHGEDYDYDATAEESQGHATEDDEKEHPPVEVRAQSEVDTERSSGMEEIQAQTKEQPEVIVDGYEAEESQGQSDDEMRPPEGKAKPSDADGYDATAEENTEEDEKVDVAVPMLPRDNAETPAAADGYDATAENTEEDEKVDAAVPVPPKEIVETPAAAAAAAADGYDATAENTEEDEKLDVVPGPPKVDAKLPAADGYDATAEENTEEDVPIPGKSGVADGYLPTGDESQGNTEEDEERPTDAMGETNQPERLDDEKDSKNDRHVEFAPLRKTNSHLDPGYLPEGEHTEDENAKVKVDYLGGDSSEYEETKHVEKRVAVDTQSLSGMSAADEGATAHDSSDSGEDIDKETQRPIPPLQSTQGSTLQDFAAQAQQQNERQRNEYTNNSTPTMSAKKERAVETEQNKNPTPTHLRVPPERQTSAITFREVDDMEVELPERNQTATGDHASTTSVEMDEDQMLDDDDKDLSGQQVDAPSTNVEAEDAEDKDLSGQQVDAPSTNLEAEDAEDKDLSGQEVENENVLLGTQKAASVDIKDGAEGNEKDEAVEEDKKESTIEQQDDNEQVPAASVETTDGMLDGTQNESPSEQKEEGGTVLAVSLPPIPEDEETPAETGNVDTLSKVSSKQPRGDVSVASASSADTSRRRTRSMGESDDDQLPPPKSRTRTPAKKRTSKVASPKDDASESKTPGRRRKIPDKADTDNESVGRRTRSKRSSTDHSDADNDSVASSVRRSKRRKKEREGDSSAKPSAQVDLAATPRTRSRAAVQAVEGVATRRRRGGATAADTGEPEQTNSSVSSAKKGGRKSTSTPAKAKASPARSTRVTRSRAKKG